MASDPQMRALSGDAAERERVLDPARSFLVQAPAGSGKTELLMQRYLTLLAHESVQAPESVLAITFTRKAAAELRKRVLDALQDVTKEPPESPHERLTRDLARRVVEREAAMGWKLLEHPERLEIRTVDSFCEKIAERTPLLARLGTRPTIAEDFGALYLEAAQRTLLMMGDADEAVRAAAMQLLTDRDNNFDRTQQLLVELLWRREQWLHIVGRSDQYTPEDATRVRETLERSLRDAISAELAQIRTTLAECLPADEKAELMEYCCFAGIHGEPESGFRCLRGLKDLPSGSAEDLAKWQAIRAICLTQGGGLRKDANNKGFPAGMSEKGRCKEWLKRLAALRGAERIRAALSRLDMLPPVTFSEGEWASLKALFRVLPLLAANLRTVFAEHGEVDYSEVAMAANAALGEPGEPTDLGLHLGYKIQHLLVDEFQDTSISQLELLKRLIQPWSPETGATLFAVGDPMQSIYSFRQADVTLFLRTRANGLGDWMLEPAVLRSNFRSRPALVQWFNDTFQDVLTEDSDVTGAVKYERAQAERPEEAGSGVKVHPLAPKDYEGEAAQVVEVVRQELARGANTIAILVRSRTHLRRIAPALRDAGIAVRAKDIDQLAERQTVLDLHAFTKALLNRADRTAWLAMLRGPWCGLDLADLWELCRGDSDSTVWELLNSRMKQLSERAQKVLARVMPPLQAALEKSWRTPMDELVRSLWVSLGGPASLAGAEKTAKIRDANAYFTLLQKVGAHGEVDEARMKKEMEWLFAPADTASDIRVELMTIHGAKGLQFDVVIVPGLNSRTLQDKEQLLNWRERVVDEKRDLLLAPMSAVGKREDKRTFSRYIADLNKECSTEETKRLLYVAATRAKERLHLLAVQPEPDKAPDSGSFLSLLPEGVKQQFLEPVPENEAHAAKTAQKPLHRLPEDWRVPAAPEPVRFEARYAATGEHEQRRHTYERVGEDLRRIGTVTHRILQQIGDEGVERWNAERVAKAMPMVRMLLVQEGIGEKNLGAAEKRIRRALENTIVDQQGRWILEKRDEAANEYALSAILDGERANIKVDRTFVVGDTRWLVDYKTSDQEGTITEEYLQEQLDKYREDLVRYARILKAADGRTVKGGLYFPLLQRWREVEF